MNVYFSSDSEPKSCQYKLIWEWECVVGGRLVKKLIFNKNLKKIKNIFDIENIYNSIIMIYCIPMQTIQIYCNIND